MITWYLQRQKDNWSFIVISIERFNHLTYCFKFPDFRYELESSCIHLRDARRFAARNVWTILKPKSVRISCVSPRWPKHVDQVEKYYAEQELIFIIVSHN